MPTDLSQWVELARNLSVAGVLATVIFGLVKWIDWIRKGEWYPKLSYDELKLRCDAWQAVATKATELNERNAEAIERMAAERDKSTAALERITLELQTLRENIRAAGWKAAP